MMAPQFEGGGDVLVQIIKSKFCHGHGIAYAEIGSYRENVRLNFHILPESFSSGKKDS